MLKIITLLKKEGANIQYNDPYVLSFTLNNQEYYSLKLDEATLRKQDLVLITTDHSSYDYARIAAWARLIFDTRNATKDVKVNREKIHLL